MCGGDPVWCGRLFIQASFLHDRDVFPFRPPPPTQLPTELQRLIRSAFPPTKGTSEDVALAVYEALEFYQSPEDDEFYWGNIGRKDAAGKLKYPDADVAERGLMNAILTAAQSAALARLSSTGNQPARDFADLVMETREKANKLAYPFISAGDALSMEEKDKAWSALDPLIRYGKFVGPGGSESRNSNALEGWEERYEAGERSGCATSNPLCTFSLGC